MSEQLLSGLFGKVDAKELPLTMSPRPTTEPGRTSKTENLLQTNPGEESFSAKLAFAVENMSASNKQATAFAASRSTLSNQEEDVNLIMEMISKGILPDMEGLQEQLSQALNSNMSKETFISNGINYISDSNTTPVPIQLNTLLLNDVRPNLAEVSEGILSPAKPMKLSGEEISFLAKAVQNGEEISSLAKAVQNGEEISSLVKAVQNDEEKSSLAKAMKNGEEISFLAKAVQNGEEISPLAKAVQNDGEVSSLVKATRLNGEGILSPVKSMKNGERISSEGISSVAKSTESGEEISLLTKDTNDKNLYSNPGNRVYGQLASQDVNKTVPKEPGPNLSLRQDSVQAEVEDSELHHALNVSKSQDFTTSLNDNNIPGSVRADESTNQATASQDSSFLNNQGSDTTKGADINLTNIKQGIEPKIDFATVSRQTNVPQPFESLGVDLVDNFIQRARLFMQGDKSAIRLQLNPPELGSLKLEFTVEDEVLEAKIFVERSAVKEIIEKDIPRLRELISNTEIDVGKLDVFLQEKEDERLGFMDKGFQSDLERDQTQEYTNQEKEDFGGEVNEELELNAVSTNKINYLV